MLRRWDQNRSTIAGRFVQYSDAGWAQLERVRKLLLECKQVDSL